MKRKPPESVASSKPMAESGRKASYTVRSPLRDVSRRIARVTAAASKPVGAIHVCTSGLPSSARARPNSKLPLWDGDSRMN